MSVSKLNSSLKSKSIAKMCSVIISFALMVIMTISMIGNDPDVVVIKIIIPQLFILHNMYVTICNFTSDVK